MSDETSTADVRRDDAIRVAVVDDHPIARLGIEHVLSAASHIEVVCSTGSVAELCRELERGAGLDALVLDLYLDGDTPALAEVAELSRTNRVLIMSASGRAADVLGAIRAGANGYITKRSSPELIVSTVETVAAGGFLLSGELADVIQNELVRHAPPPAPSEARPSLSPREEQTLNLVAKGFTHAQIATRLDVRKATVDTYVERIRAKLQLGNKAELTRAALERLAAPAREKP